MTVYTIDVSEHDWNRRGGNLDWVAVRNAGIVGMCARATYGDPAGYRFPSYHFGDFLRAAKAAGFVLRGGYHNLVKGDQSSCNRQVDWLRRELDGHDGNWAMLDVERYPELVASDMWPRWDSVMRFHDRWHALDGRVLAGYIPPWMMSHLGYPDLRAFRGPLIPSVYPLGDIADEYRTLYARCGGDSGSGWRSYGNRVPEGWQYSSHGRVPGAAYICDVNAWRMTSEQLTSLLTGEEDVSDAFDVLWKGGTDMGPAVPDALSAPFGTYKNGVVDRLFYLQKLLEGQAKRLDALEAKLADPVDEAALAAQLADLLQPLAPGATVEQIRQLLATVRLTPGA